MAKNNPNIWGRVSDDYNATGIDDETSNNLLSDSIQKRYGKITPNNWVDTLDRVYKDMGLSKYNTEINPSLENLKVGKAPVYGLYDFTKNQLTLDRNQLAAQKVATGMHELGHMADMASDFYALSKGAKTPGAGLDNPNHHRDFVNFEAEMPLVMESQNYIENGIPVDKEVMDRYPQLKKVVPKSSNMLAVPWNSKRMTPPAIWNKMNRDEK